MRRLWSSSLSVLRVDLLGRDDGQVGDLAADLADRAAGLLLDVAARVVEHLLARLLRVHAGVVLGLVRGLARAGDDLVGLLARLTQALAVLVQDLVGLRRVRSAASIDSAIARLRFSSAVWIRGNASLRSKISVTPNASSVQSISPSRA